MQVYNIWGFHENGNSNSEFLGCVTVRSDTWIPVFQWYILPLLSGWNISSTWKDFGSLNCLYPLNRQYIYTRAEYNHTKVHEKSNKAFDRNKVTGQFWILQKKYLNSFTHLWSIKLSFTPEKCMGINIICSVHCDDNYTHTPTNAHSLNYKSTIYMDSPTCFRDKLLFSGRH
jgi:hypothetical protein